MGKPDEPEPLGIEWTVQGELSDDALEALARWLVADYERENAAVDGA